MEPTSRSPYVVGPLPGFTPAVGHLVSMMNYVRMTTLRAVEGLGVGALDHLLDGDANSIGMLLEHAACVEEWYQEATLGITFDEEARTRRKLGADLGQPAREAIRGRGLDAYLRRLGDVRRVTLKGLADRDDAWLFEESRWGDDVSNNYFKWFHVFEDELNHRGQIRIIRRRLPPELRPA